MKKCGNSWERAHLLKLFVWLLELGVYKENIELAENINKLWKYILIAENEYSTDNIWHNIRKAEGISQINMADILQINVKRYRRLEREEQLPDAYILLTLYQKLHYSPLIFLEDRLYFPDVLNRIWDMFSEETQDNFKFVLNKGISLFQY